uniref:Signal peptidase complex subunit 1 n=1 Tax=Bursaphelenchus xylophilus TaxID=6326 RepID=A0A1I7RL36_BURXY
MLPAPIRRFSTHMDFVGQQKAERIMQVILVISGIIGFLVGFWFERISFMVFTILGGSAFAGLIMLPPWPCFRRNALNWQPALQPDDTQKKEKEEGSKKKKN